jgi:hypothetical protein
MFATALLWAANVLGLAACVWGIADLRRTRKDR